MNRDQIIALIQQQLQQNYVSGNPQVAPHQHNGVDNLQIQAKDILGFSAGGISNMVAFTSSGTFTVPTGVTDFLIEGVGAGAGGYGVASGLTSVSGGGGGAYCRRLVGLISGSNISVTIGAGGTGGSSGGANAGTDGGDTKFGTYFTAGGGKASGTGGTGTSSGLNIAGGTAASGTQFITTGTSHGGVGGNGGGSYFGQGAFGAYVFSGSNGGNAATVYGAGGSGAVSASSGGAQAGGNGFGGLVIITW